jgi:hypothetical protein
LTGYYNQGMDTELTFVGSPEALFDDLEAKHLRGAYLVLRFKPTCECGKEFRASGEDRALQQVAKHIETKKYKDCKPVVVEQTYVLPEFVTIEQMFESDANVRRNKELYDTLSTSHLQMIQGYQITKGINVRGTIIKKTQVRDVSSKKTGQHYKVCEVTLQDEREDHIAMTLWNGQTDSINEGDEVTIRNAYIKNGQHYYGSGYGFGDRTELALYKNASTITVDKKATAQEEPTS